MINRAVKLRWRRRFRRSRVAVEDFGVQTEESLERHLFRRLSRVYSVRRFILAWIILIGLMITGVVLQTRGLSSYYQRLSPVPGGTYTEGIVGSFTNANPIYASGGVDRAVSRLIFSGLLKYDDSNNLVGDLAENWAVDPSELRYTVRLRPNLRWHDGQPLTVDDVIFTYATIQKPDAKSPLLPSWQGIVLEKVDDRTMTFVLPNSLSSFPHALTNGIVPKHLLETTPVSQLRSERFNTVAPIGSGPFRLEAIEISGTTPEDRRESIGLVAYDNYHDGAPKLQRFTIHSFKTEKELLESFERRELNAVVGLTGAPDTLRSLDGVEEHSIPLTGEVVVFFKTTSLQLNDAKVRQALVKAADTGQIIQGLDHPVIAARGPLLSSHTGYDKSLVQFPTNVAEANGLLDAAGWLMGPDGIRLKDGQPLRFTLYGQSTSEYQYVTQILQKQWRAVGINVVIDLKEDNELQTIVAEHSYDALLYGISLGTDPDAFAYWHSSQADPRAATRLNLSEYRSSVADNALEAGRTRSDITLRAAKYRPFLEAWRNDAPALVLYQPRFLYITNGNVYGFNPKLLNNATERFNNVHQWMVREVKTNK